MNVLAAFLALALIIFIYLYFKKSSELKETTEKLELLKSAERTFEQKNYIELLKETKSQEENLSALRSEMENLRFKIRNTEKSKEHAEKQLQFRRNDIKILKMEADVLLQEIELQDYGIYKPRYDFANSTGYKERLTELRNKQKNMVKDKTAVSYYDNWTINGSKREGKKMMNSNIKQILRMFNNECEVLISKVTYKNFDSIIQRIEKIYNDLNKLNNTHKLSIKREYLQLKIDEAHLAFEYKNVKEDEKEALRLEREQQREEKALQREINEKKQIVDKDIMHYKNIIINLMEKKYAADDPTVVDNLDQQIDELNLKINEREAEKEELDYREAHSGAGYVYIISNIGAFGKGVVKIGVTRRIDPEERIKELSSASVPFTYDVHALIFSYEAYELERELHEYFTEHRVNKVNRRKEFFNISIDKIEEKLKDYGELTIDFNRIADAEEYRETLALNKEKVS